MSLYVNAIIYDGIASGRNKNISKRGFALKSEVEINHAGITPSIKEKIEVRITRYKVLKE
tara:strand:+ start:260 stop:439 length:180 start_codon:yes stop_codon:yes gene_type:complete